MAFDVPPARPSGRRPRIPAAAIVAAGGALVAVALATSRPALPPSPAPGTPQSSGGPIAVADPSTTPAPPSQRPAPRRALRVPRDVVCHDLDRAACDTVARASVGVLPDDVTLVAAIEAWSSILCGDTLDCPPGRLSGTEPLGSAVVSFAAGQPRAWINVVSPSAGTAAGTPTDAVAWIVRWQP